MTRPSKTREDAAEAPSLFDWADREAARHVIDFAAKRSELARWKLVFEPRSRTLQALELRFHRRLGLAPPPPIVDFATARRRA